MKKSRKSKPELVYQLLWVHDNMNKFVRLVSDYMSNGWDLHGDTIIMKVEQSDGTKKQTKVDYYQAVKKEN